MSEDLASLRHIYPPLPTPKQGIKDLFAHKDRVPWLTLAL